MIELTEEILQKDFEMVERKGIGHPDTICDAIAEKISQLYSKYCLEKYGRVAHHWFDKVLLIGGECNIVYGDGYLIKPYKLFIVGKCARQVIGENVPLKEIFSKAAEEVFSKVLTGFNIDEHLVIIDETVDYHGAGRGSERYKPEKIDDLSEATIKDKRSNDCNLLSAHYPLTLLETIVINTENYLNGQKFKNIFDMTGWDIKIVGVREKDNIQITVNIPILINKINSNEQYKTEIGRIYEHLKNYYLKNYRNSSIELIINPQDLTGKPYLTLFGSAADTGDVGVVGRGNRANGLISPMQPMSIEASAGKNPIDHTGKVYTILAEEISEKIYKELGVPNKVYIYTYKEVPVDKPLKIIISVENKEGLDYDIEKEVNQCISNMDYYINESISEGRVMW